MSLSRRKFIVTSAAGAFAGAIVRPSLLDAWQQPQTPPQTPAAPPQITGVFTPIRGNVGFFTGQGGTIGYYLGKSGVVVVDTQSVNAAKILIDGLNERSGGKPIELVINTHHHGDHTGGNPAFKGVAKHILAQEKVIDLQRAAAVTSNTTRVGRGQAPIEPVFADVTFGGSWSGVFDDEKVSAVMYGPAHTGSDSIIYFEKANVAHMGDLVFNRRHPVTDRPGGCNLKSWAGKVEKAAKDYPKDTVFILGHAGTNFPVTGSQAELLVMRDYLNALLDFTDKQKKAGKTRDEIIAIRDVLPGFPDHGPLVAGPLGAAFDELSS
jgi:cyclase